MTTGEKILAMRKARGWSQEELAQWTGVSRQAVSRWESDSAMPDSEKLIALCECFGVSADYLLGIASAKGETRVPADSVIHTSYKKLTGYQILGTVFAMFGILCRLCLELLGIFRPHTLFEGTRVYHGLQAHIRVHNLQWVMVLVWTMVLLGVGMLVWPLVKKRIPSKEQSGK